jgi:hypothetical protein
VGQPITVEKQALGDIALFDTNRSITGQDGAGYDSAEAAAAAPGYPAELAGRLFGADDAISHVFVLSNGVSVKRAGGWDDVALGGSAAVIEEFFVFYRDGAAASG